MRMLSLLLLLAVASDAAATPPAADPASLFEGRSEGHGTLTLGFGHPRAYRVENVGQRQPDGSFRLDQLIRFEGEPPRARHWLIRAAGEGRYTFTLSDAAGPGVATLDGEGLSLRYAPVHGMRMRQRVERRADGTLANTGSIRVLGVVPVGHLSETITPLH